MLMAFAQARRVDLGFVGLGGPGLGNQLFSWARFAVATRDYQLVPLAPTWFQLRPGPIRRLERDLRLYNGLFRHPEYVYGFRRLAALYSLPRFPEQDLYDGKLDRSRDKIVIFQGMKGMFKPFLREHEFLRAELLRMTRPEHLSRLREADGNTIAMHIRCGDFRAPRYPGELREGRTNLRTPTSWFVAVGKRLREHLGADVPIRVFSDGAAEELAALADLPNCARVTFGSAVADLFAMTRAKILVMSRSSFSMWAAFLGRMPIIHHPGQKAQLLYYDQPDAAIEYDPEEPLPAPFAELVRSAVAVNHSPAFAHETPALRATSPPGDAQDEKCDRQSC